MGREIKRVPPDFAWPFSMSWKGYMCPYTCQRCEVCDGTGYNPETKKLRDAWYDHEGTGQRWCDKLTQDEVDALIEKGRLVDFTHTFVPDKGWVKKDPPPVVTPEMVNDWSRRGLGHDSINHWICLETRAKRLGVWGHCPVCEGRGEIWFNDKIRELSEAWYENERYDPPTGEGWQVWETVSEGRPISPVFATSDEAIDWLVERGYSRKAATAFVEEQQWVPSMMIVPGKGLVRDIEAAG